MFSLSKWGAVGHKAQGGCGPFDCSPPRPFVVRRTPPSDSYPPPSPFIPSFDPRFILRGDAGGEWFQPQFIWHGFRSVMPGWERGNLLGFFFE
jgi:hypothetical protein